MKPGWYLRNFGWIPRPVRQVIVCVIGGTLLLLALIGFLIPVLPGFIFVPLALAVLAAEFAWATRWLIKIKSGASSVHTRMKAGWNCRWPRAPKPTTNQSSPPLHESPKV